MPAELGNTNRRDGFLFREVVSLQLQLAGIDATARTGYLTDPEEPHSHLTGVADWAFEVRTQKRRDLAGALEEAQAAAEHDGKRHGVAIFKKFSAPTKDSYVVLPLQTFATLISKSQA